MIIYLKEKLGYTVLLTDPNFQFFSTNPGTVPKRFVNIRSGKYLVYLKVYESLERYLIQIPIYLQPVRHELLNLDTSPCEPDVNYKFCDCVETFMMEKVGCKPPWRRFDIDHLPVCTNYSQMTQYSDIYLNHATMPQRKLISRTNCLYPCSYMEYKVT